MSTFKDFFKVVLGSNSAYSLTLCRNSGGLHLHPVCFDTGKGHLCTLYARRPLHCINMQHRTKELLHQAKITLRLCLFRPQTTRNIPHGESG